MRGFIGFYLLTLFLAGCSKASDLTAPCPNYGKRCQQGLINQEPLKDKS